MIKAIIVDDENTSIKSLRWEIENFCEGIQVVESFTNPIEAISAINYIKPDCIFLDIEMPEMDGFKLLSELRYRDFDLIITTAYDSYALQAFKESAIDYLLKPVDSDDLIKAVNKVKVNKTKNSLGKELQIVLHNLTQESSPKKIMIPLSGKTMYEYPENILYCKSDGNYTAIHFKNNEVEMISKKIKDVEKMFNHESFFRIHNSYVVNIQAIKEYIKTEGQHVVLENGTAIPVSRNKKNVLLRLLSNSYLSG